MIRKIQEGDQEMFRELVLKYYDDIFRYCYYKTGNEQAAYDCAQDTFLNLTRFIYAYAEKRKFRAWLFSIARNVCHDSFRKRSGAGDEVSLEEAWLQETAGGRPDEAIERMEVKDMLKQALDRLPTLQREAVVLHYMYDFKLREVADMTGVPVATAKSRLRQGLMKLREMIGIHP